MKITRKLLISLAVAATVVAAVTISTWETDQPVWDGYLPPPIQVSMEKTFGVSLDKLPPDDLGDVLFDHYRGDSDVFDRIEKLEPQAFGQWAQATKGGWSDDDDGTTVISYDFRGVLQENNELYYEQEVMFWFSEDTSLTNVSSVVYIYTENYILYLSRHNDNDGTTGQP